jgi:mRNA interferase MazF
MWSGKMQVKRGEIFLANLEPVKGSEQGKIRPVLIIQNDLGNEVAPTTIIAPLTSNTSNKNFPVNVFVPKNISKLDKDSMILLNQIRTIDKSRIIKRITALDYDTMKKVDLAVKISLDIE